jgi:hypothetical protein
MRHRWKKKGNELIVNKDGRLKYTIRACHICIHCGLKKGNAYVGRNYFLVYFKDGKILSKNILPFKCIGKNHGWLLTEEDFKL